MITTCGFDDHPKLPLESSTQRIPVRPRIRMTSPDGQTHYAIKNGISKTLQHQNQKLKHSLHSISNTVSQNFTNSQTQIYVNCVLLKYQSQMAKKNLKINTLQRKLKLALAHLPEAQCETGEKVDQKSQLRKGNERDMVTLMQKIEQFRLEKEEKEQTIAELKEKVRQSEIDLQNISSSVHQSTQKSKICQEIQEQVRQFLVAKLPPMFLQQHDPSMENFLVSLLSEHKESYEQTESENCENSKCRSTKDKKHPLQKTSEKIETIDIYKTIENLIDRYEEQSKQFVEMEQIIEDLKNSIQQKQQESKTNIKIRSQLQSSLELLKEQNQILQLSMSGNEEKLPEMETSLNKDRLESSDNMDKGAIVQSFYKNMIANEREGNSEGILLGEDNEQESFMSQSERDLKQMKAIYEAAQSTLEQNKKLSDLNYKIIIDFKKLEEQLVEKGEELQRVNSQMKKLKIFLSQNKLDNSPSSSGRETIQRQIIEEDGEEDDEEEDDEEDEEDEEEDEEEEGEQIFSQEFLLDKQQSQKHIARQKYKKSRQLALKQKRRQLEDVTEEVKKLIAFRVSQQQILSNEREQQLLFMLCSQLDSVFSHNIFKGHNMRTLHERIVRLKSYFKKGFEISPNDLYQSQLSKLEELLVQNQECLQREMEVESLVVNQSGERKNQMDLTQAKLYLNELEIVIRKLQVKIENDTIRFEQNFEENEHIQNGLMNQIRDLTAANRSHVKKINEAIIRMGKASDHFEIEEIMEYLRLHLFAAQRESTEWDEQFYQGQKDQTESQFERKVVNRVGLVEDMKKKYFGKPTEYIESLIEDILELTVSTTEEELIACLQKIFQNLKDKEDKQKTDKVKKEQMIKEKAEYINELCKKGRESGFGEQFSESKSQGAGPWRPRTSRMSQMRGSKVIQMRGSKLMDARMLEAGSK